jgi:predicted translin family RNA/ssDNA-binding protein
VKILDKAKAAAETAAAKAKEGVEDVQTKRDLAQAYGELGRTTLELVDAGELSHARLTPIVEKIHALVAKVDEPAAPVEHDPSKPPAMPV